MEKKKHNGGFRLQVLIKQVPVEVFTACGFVLKHLAISSLYFPSQWTEYFSFVNFTLHCNMSQCFVLCIACHIMSCYLVKAGFH